MQSLKTKNILIVAASVLLAGCFKEVTMKTNYVLQPVMQATSTGTYEPLEGVQAYSYGVDTTLWGVASYEDALAGIITSKNDPALKMTAPEAVSAPVTTEGTVGWIQMTISRSVQMIVAVDPTSKIYAYTEQELSENLFDLYVTLPFQPWRPGFSYKQGNWSYYNNFYVPPITSECSLAPLIQAEQGGAEVSPANKNQIQVYAYAVDTVAWYIASYDDALNHKLTPRDNTQTPITNYDFLAYPNNSFVYFMTVAATPLMVVAVDSTNKLYAYSKQELVLGEGPVTFPQVVFRLWSPDWIQVQPGGWRVVNQKNKPAEPEAPDPENPENPSKR